MNDNEWQVLVRGSRDDWRSVPDGRTAARFLREFSDLYVQARVREVGPWRLMPEPDDSGREEE